MQLFQPGQVVTVVATGQRVTVLFLDIDRRYWHVAFPGDLRWCYRAADLAA
jgi:hypothetical protein